MSNTTRCRLTWYCTLLSILLALSSLAVGQENIFPPDGNVGIGTAQPLTPLDIRDNRSGRRTILTLRTAESAPGTEGRLDWAQSRAVTGRIANAFEGRSQLGLAFHTYFEGLDEAMRISAQGNVGIGTTSPEAKLDVVGPIKAATVTITADARLKTNSKPSTLIAIGGSVSIGQ